MVRTKMKDITMKDFVGLTPDSPTATAIGYATAAGWASTELLRNFLGTS